MKGYLQELRRSHSDSMFLLKIFQAHFFDMCYPYTHLETMPWMAVKMRYSLTCISLAM